ncbi:AMY-like protein [Mya arenaria]|uniref:AMY-like protein n=1 Tax=Mya arenaria TaxID=6604 RepID=A0ABY7F2R3_MYAAR|nr:AMY-like protein [Mya arenaria]
MEMGDLALTAMRVAFPEFPTAQMTVTDMIPAIKEILASTTMEVEVRNCRLVGLADLRLGSDYVRGKVADYFNKLIGFGVAGFRVDADKHMWPGDLENIFGRLQNLRSNVFGSGKKYLPRITNFKYGVELANIFLRYSNQAKWLRKLGEGWSMPHTNDVFVFLSNHVNQRGHGGGGAPITFRNPKQLKIATAFMLAHPYGFPRVMSSYEWTPFVANFYHSR